MQRVCMAFDIYFDPVLLKSCANNDEKLIGDYLRKINLGQYKRKTFDATIEEGLLFDSKAAAADNKAKEKEDAAKKEQEKEDKRPIEKRMVDKWGDGLSYMDYRELDKHYRYLKDANPNCDSNQEIFIIDLCYTKMQQMKAIRDGDVDSYNKLTDLYRKSFQQAGLKTGKENGANDGFSLGVTIETIEQYTPAEYYKDKKLYSDYDGIGEYAERFILRPLKNLMHGTHDRDPEYCVTDGGDSDGPSN